MIDIHCHILPGIDDGPATMEESIEMCRMAASDGIKTVVATPHFNPHSYDNSSSKVFELIDLLTTKLKENGIDIQILPGAEVAITPELLVYLKKEKYLTINKNEKYILVEFPHASVFPKWEEFLINLLDESGIVPVIAHPERNAWFLKHPEALYPVVEKGVMAQITAMGVTGEFGNDVRRFSLFLLEHNLAHLIATDAHSAFNRPPLLADAVQAAAAVIGKEEAEALVTSTPAAIVEGRPAVLHKPFSHLRKKKTWMQRLYFRYPIMEEHDEGKATGSVSGVDEKDLIL